MDTKKLPIITKRKLSLANGQDSDNIWVAYNGIVYDFSTSALWKNGKHYEHWAGQDLTEELKHAPHTEIVFKRTSIVGRLEG